MKQHHMCTHNTKKTKQTHKHTHTTTNTDTIQKQETNNKAAHTQNDTKQKKIKQTCQQKQPYT